MSLPSFDAVVVPVQCSAPLDYAALAREIASRAAAPAGEVAAAAETGVGQTGTVWTSFSLALNSAWKDRSGQRHERTTSWVRVVAYGPLAKTLQRLVTGDEVAVVDALRSRTYETATNEKRTAFEIVAREVRFLRLKDRAAASEAETEILEGRGRRHLRSEALFRGGAWAALPPDAERLAVPRPRDSAQCDRDPRGGGAGGQTVRYSPRRSLGEIPMKLGVVVRLYLASTALLAVVALNLIRDPRAEL